MDPVVPVRNEDGTFPKGVSGNPKGRPPSRRAQIDQLKQDLEIAVRGHIQPAQVVRIITKMAQLAEEGNTKAAKLVLDLAVSSAAVQSDAKELPPGITIRIENATLFAKQQETAIEAKVIEVPSNVD
jgi:hypothetical protein